MNSMIANADFLDRICYMIMYHASTKAFWIKDIWEFTIYIYILITYSSLWWEMLKASYCVKKSSFSHSLLRGLKVHIQQVWLWWWSPWLFHSMARIYLYLCLVSLIIPSPYKITKIKSMGLYLQYLIQYIHPTTPERHLNISHYLSILLLPLTCDLIVKIQGFRREKQTIFKL